MVVEKNIHPLKLKCFNTNCRVQIQHVGKISHSPQDHLKKKSPVKYFAEDILYPICATIEDDINIEKEKRNGFASEKEGYETQEN